MCLTTSKGFIQVNALLLSDIGKKYDLITADCPWRYSFSKSKSRKVENHYPTMTVEEICALPIDTIAEENCILFLWATAPKLREALRVMEEWGFEYKTHSIWDKKKIGMGYYWRGRHELLLVGTKGKTHPPLPEVRESSIFEGKRGKHSKKPEYARQMIERMYPDTNKIELFSREYPEGWDVWGNEVETIIQL
jgi:N6-adenosine-specific RNA methylase IME4